MRPTMLNFSLPIETPRIIMRQPIMGYVDSPEYLVAVEESLRELQPWCAWAQYLPSRDSSEEYVRECCANWILKTNNNIGLTLWMFDKDTNKFIGIVVLWNIVWDVPKYEIGYWVRSSYSGKGYVTEAVNAVTRYLFLQMNARRLEIKTEPKNVKSYKVAERLGYQLEAVLKNYSLATCDGTLSDCYFYSRTDMFGLPDLKVKW
jgi:RimJ/RimL family protein N-acetyltransferase